MAETSISMEGDIGMPNTIPMGAARQPTGESNQAQTQDPLQSIVQQLLYFQQLEYILAQHGHM